MKKSLAFKILLCAICALLVLSACQNVPDEPEQGETNSPTQSETESSGHEETEEPTPDDRERPDPVEVVSSEYFTFRKLEDGTYAVSLGKMSDTPENLVIPNAYNGIPVTVISQMAFYKCDVIKSVVISDGITTIEEYAFNSCASLESVTIPDSVTTIESSAFSFSPSLESVNIGANVASIGEEAFSSCDSLESINVDENNENFKSVDGVLYNKEGTVLVQYPGNKSGDSFVIPEGVTSIGNYAFKSCNTVKFVTLPESLTSIGTEAFEYCELLTLDISDNVVSIGEDAFRSCSALVSVRLGSGVKKIAEDAFSSCYKLAEVLNQSNHIKIIKGNSNNGGIGEYADLIFNSNGEELESVLVTDENGFITYTDNGDVVLVSYIGDELNIEIPGNVTKIDDCAFFSYDHLLSVIIPEGVKYIGQEAFYGCSSITQLVIPDSVTRIADRAFGSYSRGMSLVSLTLGSGLTELGYHSFDSCYTLVELINRSNLVINKDNDYDSMLGEFAQNIYNPGDEFTKINYTVDDNGFLTYVSGDDVILVTYIGDATNIVIPDNVTKIMDFAFYLNASIESVVIPNSVTYIGNNVFQYCENIESITMSENVKYIGEYAFGSCYALRSIVIPEGVTTIPYGAFYNCQALQKVTISDGVTEIGEMAFSGCVELKDLPIPNSVVTIGEGAFGGCDGLVTLTIPNGVEFIEEDAFYGCGNLVSVTIPESVRSIGEDAFAACRKLVEVVNRSTHFTVEKNSEANGSIGRRAVFVYNSGDEFTQSNLDIDQNGYLTYVDGEDVVFLGYFGSDPHVVIPDGVTKIADIALYDNRNIVSIIIPDSVVYIGVRALSFTSLESVTIGNGVTTIGDEAFLYSTHINGIIIPESVQSIGAEAFEGCGKMQYFFFEDDANWHRTTESNQSGGIDADVSDDKRNITYFEDTYADYYWYKE